MNLRTLMRRVGKLYREEGEEAEWIRERRRVRSILKAVTEFKDFETAYEITGVIGLGSSGIVLRARDRGAPFDRALKVPRPRNGRQRRTVKLLREEIEKLLSLNHQNVIRVYYRDEVSVGREDVPFYVMECVDGAKNLGKYVSEGNLRSVEELAELLRQAFEGVTYIHARNMIHVDLKPGNILVGVDSSCVITDLGFAKYLTGGSATTELGFTDRYAHPELRALVSRMSRRSAATAGVRETDLHQRFDLYAMGKSMFELISNVTPALMKPELRPKIEHLRIIAARLLDGCNTEGDTVYDLNNDVMNEIKYGSAADALEDFDRLLGLTSAELEVEELNRFHPRTVRLPVSGRTVFTRRLKEIVEHPSMSRLGDVRQLALLNLVYPGAVHSRLEHCLGSYANACDYVLALYNDAENPLFRSIMRWSDLQLAILASLLHDIGQYPLAHDLADADQRFRHERYSEERFGDAEDKKSLANMVQNLWPVNVRDVLRLMTADLNELGFRERILRSICDGAIDCDKLDYLRRDSIHLGLPYGQGIDYERLLKCLTVVVLSKSSAEVGIGEKGKVAAEAAAFARYAMFATAYWHHTARAIKAMLRAAALDALRNSKETGTEDDFWTSFDDAAFESQPGAQLELEDADSRQTPRLIEEPAPVALSQISSSDRRVLMWLHSQAGRAGKRLIEGLLARRLYKRVYTSSGDTSDVSWAHFYERVGICVEHPDTYHDFRKEVQKDLFTKAGLAADPVELETKLLILIDAPRKGPPGQLKYRRERTLEASDLEDSLLWRNLHQDFDKSASKIRVFADASIADRLRDLGREEIENAIRRHAGLN